MIQHGQITVGALSKAWTIFARSKTGIMGSNPTQGIDVCLRLFSVCVGSGLATSWSSAQGVLPTVVWLINWSETKRFMDALCSKWEQQEKRDREREGERYNVVLRAKSIFNFRFPLSHSFSKVLRNWAQRHIDLPITNASGPVLGSTQLFMQCVRDFPSRTQSGQEVMLTTELYLDRGREYMELCLHSPKRVLCVVPN
jgi:hypothetical protein